MSLGSERLEQLELIALKIREDIIKSLLIAKSGHSAGPLGVTDILTTLYFHILNHDPKNPKLETRDRFILSAGHLCPALYVTLAHSGYFKLNKLATLRKFGSGLQGHPHNLALAGIENSSGPLGQGISQAVGVALGVARKGLSSEVFILGSDGEMQEGQVWEAIMFAGQKRVNHLTYFIDRNNIQIDGFVDNIMGIDPLKTKLESFNWHVQEINGHNILEIINAVELAKAVHDKPSAIIARTIPGKGVKFMENKFEWHGKPPDEKEAKIALHDLRTLEGQIESEHE
ncbi:MAG: transketolase [bacterium]|nr:transketolase [bacterium]